MQDSPSNTGATGPSGANPQAAQKAKDMPFSQGATTRSLPVKSEKPGQTPDKQKAMRPSFIARCKTWYRRKFIYIVVCAFLGAMFVIALWPRIFYRIESGHAAVLYRTFFGGTVTQTVRDEGLQIILPWNVLTIYDVRLQQVEHAFSVISSDGLEVKVVLSIRYHPKIEYLGLLHKRIGPEYLQKIVVPDVQSLVRATFGQYTPEEIYTTKRSLIQETFQSALGNLGDNYVEMNDLLIKSIELPPGIQSAIESKLIEQQRSLAMKFRIERETEEAARKEIEAKGEHRFQEIVGKSLTPELLQYRGIEAMLRLAESPNAKVIMAGGGGKDGSFPFILDARSNDSFNQAASNKDFFKSKEDDSFRAPTPTFQGVSENSRELHATSSSSPQPTPAPSPTPTATPSPTPSSEESIAEAQQ